MSAGGCPRLALTKKFVEEDCVVVKRMAKGKLLQVVFGPLRLVRVCLRLFAPSVPTNQPELLPAISVHDLGMLCDTKCSAT